MKFKPLYIATLLLLLLPLVSTAGGDTSLVTRRVGGTFSRASSTVRNVSFQVQDEVMDRVASRRPDNTYVMDFESVTDFSLSFNDWTVNDVDQHDTYFIDQHTFPHYGAPMAFICFNPALVVPSMASDQAIQPHSGQRFGACFSSNPPSNNDWFISPQIQLGTNGSFTFWIKSYNDTYQVDDYLVAVSTTDNNPASFTSVTGSDTLHTTTSWVKKTFYLSSFNNQTVYVAIHCVSNDHFLMMIDDLEVKPEASSTVVADFSANKTNLKVGESINFTDQSAGVPTSWTWSFPGATPATSTEQNPSGIKYTSVGTFLVKLKISDGISSDSLTKAAYITVSSYPNSISQDFESLNDFTLLFSPWTVADVRGGTTYGITNVYFPNNYLPMAYICFNPALTTPALTNMVPHSGQKLGCCFSSVPPYNPNDKWLITPKLGLGDDPWIDFWVKSYNPEWGYEYFKVAVSTTDLNPLNFVPVTTTNQQAPSDWTKMSYSLQEYANQDVYVGIQCVTDNGFVFMIDDIAITSAVGLDEENRPDLLNVFPNPAKDQITIKYAGTGSMDLHIKLINILGAEIRSWDGISAGNITLDISEVPQGIYFVQVRNGADHVTHKISVLH